MEQRNLRDKLAGLHAELERTGSVDDQTRAALVDLKGHIQEILDQRGEITTNQSGTLRERLRGDITRFEATHPHLTTAMQHVIDALVQMGV